MTTPRYGPWPHEWVTWEPMGEMSFSLEAMAALSGRRWCRWGSVPRVKTAECCSLFVDDYRLEALWRRPGRYMDLFKGRIWTGADWSMANEWPVQVIEWQAFRAYAMSRWMEFCGGAVIPCLTWGRSIPQLRIERGSVCCIRGPRRDQCAKEFAARLDYLHQVIDFPGLLVVGNWPVELVEWCEREALMLWRLKTKGGHVWVQPVQAWLPGVEAGTREGCTQ